MSEIRQRMTLPEFLSWEERQERRFEYDGYGPVAMPDSTAGHSALSVRLLAALHGRLRGGDFLVLGISMKVLVAGHVRYPDAVIVRSPVAGGTTVLTEPLVLFEIASPETGTTDHVIKNDECRDTASVGRYVILERDVRVATEWSRDGGRWLGRLAVGDALLDMPEIGIEMPLAEIYEGVDLRDASGRGWPAITSKSE